MGSCGKEGAVYIASHPVVFQGGVDLRNHAVIHVLLRLCSHTALHGGALAVVILEEVTQVDLTPSLIHLSERASER